MDAARAVDNIRDKISGRSTNVSGKPLSAGKTFWVQWTSEPVIWHKAAFLTTHALIWPLCLQFVALARGAMLFYCRVSFPTAAFRSGSPKVIVGELRLHRAEWTFS